MIRKRDGQRDNSGANPPNGQAGLILCHLRTSTATDLIVGPRTAERIEALSVRDDKCSRSEATRPNRRYW